MTTTIDVPLDERGNPAGPGQVITGGGTRILLLPVETFDGHWNNIYYVDHADYRLLVDVGTSRSLPALREALAEASRRYGCDVSLERLDAALITHAHADHFGAAHDVRALGVPLLAHELDARTLESLPHREGLYRRNLQQLGRRAGVSDELLRGMVEAPFMPFAPLVVDRRLQDGDVIGPGWPVMHAPGHSPGQVVLIVDDVVLTADHLLNRITPVQAPASRGRGFGLETYVAALRRLRDHHADRMGLGGHEGPIEHIGDRVSQTIAHHARRLSDIVHRCREQERTVAELCEDMFGSFTSHGLIIALSEVMAHVEYLYEIGWLDTVSEPMPGEGPEGAVRYRAREGRQGSHIPI